jgi:protein-S-isoprenylcysteine O-methyltransferase Ste14
MSRLPDPASDTARVIAPPPVIFAVALLLGWLIGRVAPQAFLPAAIAPWIGALAILLAVSLAGAAILQMRRARTAVDPYSPTTAVVRTGPFAVSRNPIYVALTLFSLGIAALLNALWCALLLVPALAVLRFGVIAREEAYLEGRFGDEYRTYRRQVRRWL